MIDPHRHPRYWASTEPGQWTFKGASSREPGAVTDNAATVPARAYFQITDPWPTDNAKYILIGKGYP